MDAWKTLRLIATTRDPQNPARVEFDTARDDIAILAWPDGSQTLYRRDGETWNQVGWVAGEAGFNTAAAETGRSPGRSPGGLHHE